jgi:hypothetical protein
MTILSMRIACWIPKDTNTDSELVIPVALPLQELKKNRASMLRFRYITCIVFFCRPVHVTSTVNKVAMGQVFLLLLRFFLLGNNKPTVHTHLFLSLMLYFLTDVVVKVIYLKQQSCKR